MPEGPPAVSVVVVTYNSGALIGDFLRSLPDAFGHITSEVIVADNDSADDTAAAVAAAAPDARLLPMGANLGYAAAINAAVDVAAGGRAVYILNPDVRLRPGSVAPLLDALARSDDAGSPGAAPTGIAVPRITDDAGRLLHSLRREPSVLTAFGEALIGGRRASRTSRFGEIVGTPQTYDGPATSDWASGAALLVSRRCSEVVGRWDESFFLYSEETDFCLRARDAGFTLRYVPEAEVVHIGGEQSTNPRLWSIATLNRVRLYRRRHGPLKSAAFTTGVALNEAIRAAGGSATHRAGLRALLRPSARPAEVS